MNLPSDPFFYVDNLDLRIRGWQLNLFKDHLKLCKVALMFTVFFAGLWLVMGFDSGIAQLELPLENIPNLLYGKISLDQWLSLYSFGYGKGMHWSAFVIYGAFYIFVSKHLESLGILNSKNICLSFGATLLNIAVFEYYWIYSYSYYQDQGWVATWKWPQVRILIQNAYFVLTGIVTSLYFWVDSFEGKLRKYRYQFKPITVYLLAFSLIGIYFWWNYPFPVQRFSVDIVGMSHWENSLKFPQTLYTIDVDVTDSVNAGEWFWFQNDLLHLFNTGVKVLFTLTHLYIIKSFKKEVRM